MNYEELMKRAISLANQYKYTAKPNPVVGCILIKDNKIISEGAHEKFGCNHAEINAINSAKLSLGKSFNLNNIFSGLEVIVLNNFWTIIGNLRDSDCSG